MLSLTTPPLRTQTTSPKHARQTLLLLPQLCKTTKEIQQIHSQFIKTGLAKQTFPPSQLLSFYALSPSSNLENARLIFNCIQKPDTFSWNTMIRGYSQAIDPTEALILFYQMTHYQFLPDNFTFPFVLKACTALIALDEGKQVHCWAVKLGFDSDVFVVNTLIRFYAKCGCISDAHQVFDRSRKLDLVSWNSMVFGYVDLGEIDIARQFFDRMPVRDEFSWNTIIDGYAKCGKMEIAHQLFAEMPQRDVVSWNSLIGGYIKLGEIDIALELWDQMPERNLVSWTMVILGCVQSKRFIDGLELFEHMQFENVRPNKVTIVSVLPAIGHLGARSLGEWVHTYMNKQNMGLDDSLGSALIDMYSRCGSLERALQVFGKILDKGLYSWNSMILALAIHGRGQGAIDLFSQMMQAKITPNDVTFLGILISCSHGGLVQEGYHYFELMTRVYGIVPQIKHYGCMVDLLSKAGLLREAEELISSMPVKPNAIIWNSLLGACGTHGALDVGRRMAKHLFELDPSESGPFVLLSNMYASVGQWDDVDLVRKMMSDRGIRKTPGCSSIELDGVVHEFVAGDNSHPQAKEIYSMLDGLAQHI